MKQSVNTDTLTSVIFVYLSILYLLPKSMDKHAEQQTLKDSLFTDNTIYLFIMQLLLSQIIPDIIVILIVVIIDHHYQSTKHSNCSCQVSLTFFVYPNS